MIIYVDGACSGNGKQNSKGGFGMVVYDDNKNLIDAYSHHEENTTNNIQELKAILRAMLLYGSKTNDIPLVYSDSAYCVNICNQWIQNWAKNNWIRGKNEEIKNLDIIQEIYKYINVDFPNFIIKKCAGHSNIIGNELADALASDNQAKFKTILKENNIKDKYDLLI